MAKELSELSGWVTEVDWPRVTCPECIDGTLGPDSYQRFLDPQSAALVELVNRHEAGPDETSGSFTGVLRCDNHSCQRKVAVAGDWAEMWGFTEKDGDVLFEGFRIRYMNPASPLLLTPKKTPEKVVSAIGTASAVLWISPDSAATQLRLAVEELLTALGVKRYPGGKAKRKRLSAHQRIEILKASRKEVAEILEAVKWIGNSGTHDAGLSIADVCQGAKFLEHALRVLYDTSEAEMIARVKAINKRKGKPARA